MNEEEIETPWPKMTFVLEHEGPIPLAEFTLSLQRLAARYSRETRISHPDEEPKLYIAEVRKGSVVVEFVTHHPYAAGAAVLAGIGGANTLFTFASNLKGLVEHFTGAKAGQITKADCDDMRALAGPVIHTLNAQLLISVNGSSAPLVHLTEETARVADNRAAAERLALTQQEENIREGVLLVWDQVRDAPGVDVGRSPDRAVIAEIDRRPRQVTFLSDDLKEQMGRRDFNPFEKAFVVDVKVLVSDLGIAGYRVLALHDVLDRE